jgi:hypothetical protein
MRGKTKLRGRLSWSTTVGDGRDGTVAGLNRGGMEVAATFAKNRLVGELSNGRSVADQPWRAQTGA